MMCTFEKEHFVEAFKLELSKDDSVEPRPWERVSQFLWKKFVKDFKLELSKIESVEPRPWERVREFWWESL